MSDWRIYSAQVDIKSDKILVKGERILTSEQWKNEMHNMRERNLAEQIIHDNLLAQEQGDEE